MKTLGKKVEVRKHSWRPDFRDTNSLPDVKTVRTSFFVSALALSLAVMSIMRLGFHEYSISSAEEKIEAVNAEITARQGVHAKAIGMNNKFIEKVRRIDEIDEFERDQMIASDMLVFVCKTLMPDMSLLSVEFDENKTVLHGFVVANEETDSLLRQYMERLKEIELLSERYDEFTQVSVERQPGTDQIKFHLEATRSKEADETKKKS
ncbi:MAG: hypothetical protein ACI92G_003372 [Candidatus Pelagisphaera sp.]|jgi:hypothetical protein